MSTLEGCLNKEGVKFKIWKKRWFVLKDATLYYCAKQVNIKKKSKLFIFNYEGR
jgi:hypothetical protein